MKLTIRLIILFVVDLLVAVIIYPVLHELGHSLNAIIVGAKVIEFNMFPLPCVLCDVIDVSIPGRINIGIGGVSMPIFISCLGNVKNFWVWYTSVVVKFISVLALVISAYASLNFRFGAKIINEDATQILEMWPDGRFALLIVCLVAVGYIIISVIKHKPVKRCYEYFGV